MKETSRFIILVSLLILGIGFIAYTQNQIDLNFINLL
jgi:hypothetical protein